jgi:2,4-diaminopentanoate dehydrogenase
VGRSEPYKVIVWGPGYTGTQALREIARRPELRLVGCLAYSAAKAGRDAMELIGEPPGGVRVVTDKNAIYDLAADVVLYAGRSLPDETSRHEEITTLLRSGKNVITSTAYFFPWQRGEDYVIPLEAACAAGATTLHGTGVHPGWFAERMAVAVMSLCTTVRSVSLREICDLSHHAGEAITGIGFGRDPRRLGSKTRKEILSRYYFECIAGLAHLLGIRLDAMTARVTYPVSQRQVACAAVTIQPGTVGAVDGTWTGLAREQPVITIREVWYLDRSLVDPGIDLTSDDMYEVEVKGLPVDVRSRADLSVSDRRDVFGADDRQSAANLATATQLVQTIPAVVAAAPGILLAPGFAYPSADLRRIAAPLDERPARVPEIIF